MIAGPTAVGKTAIAITIAKHFQTEIISADSRQCFKELNIGVARPSEKELMQVKHHFIASHSIHDEVNAASFETYALRKAGELFEGHDVIVMVGGTGLYIKAFCEGLDEIPPVKLEIRNNIISKFEKNGLGWLQEEIKLKDPVFYEKGEIQNPQRMMRALEVIESTGKSVLQFRSGKKRGREFSIIKIGLELSKEELHKRIEMRTDEMVKNKLVDEVSSLQQFSRLNALQTVGYSEIFDYIAGKLTLEQAISNMKINTRQYAKRQITWFKKDKNIRWHSPAEIDSIISMAGA